MSAPATENGIRGRSVDLALAAAAIAFAAPSLTYPFSHDQALFFYVGREWLRGGVPYRDVVENKTPLVYAVHALCIALTGENAWAIRALEIVAVALVGALAARLVAERSERPAAGATGASMLIASVFYYGYFPFQDSANCEIWCALFAVSAAVVARRARREGVAALASGVLLGIAFVAKPPAIAFAAIVAWSLARRPERRPWTPAAFAAGFAGVVGSTLAYFAARGALGALVDIAVRANASFARQGSNVRSAGDVARKLWDALDWFTPWSWIFLAALVVTLVRVPSRRARVGWILAWAACAYVVVAMQLRFFVYHHATFVIPCAMFGAYVWSDLVRLAWVQARPGAGAAAFAVVVVVTCVANTPRDVWWLRAKNALRFASGGISSARLLSTFDDPRYIDLTSAMRAGAWVRAHAADDDPVLVRGYSPEIYFFSHRRYGGRFFWSTMLTFPNFVWHRDDWLAGDRADLERIAPTFVIAAREAPEIESVAWFEAMGYRECAAFGPHVVLGRNCVGVAP